MTENPEISKSESHNQDHSQKHNQDQNQTKEKETERIPFSKKFANWHNKNFKLLLIIPAILLIISLISLGITYSKTGDFVTRDISLTGGTAITVFVDNPVDLNALSTYLDSKIDDFNVRELSDFTTGRQKAVIVETISDLETTRPVLEEYLGMELTNENSSIESTGSSLGESFYRQLQFAILISFVLMAFVVFFLFRTITPSLAVVISAFADIAMTLATVNLLGIKMSSAGITAILMLIGYSVDSDIMLTTRLLKREGETSKNLSDAFKTGLTMTITSIIAITVALIITGTFSNILNQIFTILIIGLGFDILNTWLTNVSILKWYLERKQNAK